MPNREPPAFLGRLIAIVDRIRASLHRVAAEAADDIERGVNALAAWLWLDRVGSSMSTLVGRLGSGTLKPIRPRARSAASLPASPAAAGLPMPRGFAWLARTLPDPAPIAAEIAALLATPELQPLLAQEPARFARILRPFCRAMGIALPEILRPAPPQPFIAQLAAAKPVIAKPVIAKPAATARPDFAPRPPPIPASYRNRLLGTTRLILEIA